MPNVGDICHGRDFGKTSGKDASRKYIFAKCPECGSERWIVKRRDKDANQSPFVTCHFCTFNKTRKDGKLQCGRGPASPAWKGGRRIIGRGYVDVWIPESHPYYAMAVHRRHGGGTILEHRLVMAEHLGRCLANSEKVHHINGDTGDNRLENLQLLSQADHQVFSMLCNKCYLRKQIRQLKAEIKSLKLQLPTML